MQYIFTAVFTKNPDGSLLVTFPDLPGCSARGATMLDAAKKAESVLSLCLFDMEQQGVAIPKPRYPDEIPTVDGEITSMILADTKAYHLRFSNKTIEYTVSIPAWLGQIARSSNVDFSRIIQDSVKRELGMPVHKVDKANDISVTPPPEAIEYNKETIDEPVKSVAQTEEPKPRPEPKPVSEVKIEKPDIPEDPKPDKQKYEKPKHEKPEPEKKPTHEKPKYEKPEPERPKYEKPKADDKKQEKSRREQSRRSRQRTGFQEQDPAKEPPVTKRKKKSILPAVLFVLIIIGGLAAVMFFTDLLDDVPVIGTFSQQLHGIRAAGNNDIYADCEVHIQGLSVAELIDHFNNPDIVGRLSIDGTNINYAVVQGVNNDFYRTHNIRRNSSDYGWIFLDTWTSVQELPNNTVIFGRMTQSGGMLYEISRFADYDFFIQSPAIHFTTFYGEHQWQPFSFYSDNSEYTFSAAQHRNWEAWVQNFANRSIHQTNINVGEDDHIITLIAECASGGSARYILHAKLVR